MAISAFQAGTTTLARLASMLEQAHSLEADADRLYVPPGDGQAVVRRLLVLVPRDAGLDAELAERAWRLASPSGLSVVLVGLAHDSASEAQRRRQLASLAALTRGEGVPVSVTLALEPSWLRAVQRLWQPGDLVVCVSGQMAAAGWLGLGRQPLLRALRAAMRAPLYQACLADEAPASRQPANPLAQALAVLGAVAILAGFFWVQAQVGLWAQGTVQSLLLFLTVIAEFALIWLYGQLLAKQ